MTKKILLAMMILGLTMPGNAQKRKSTARPKAKPTVVAAPQKTAADLLYENMLPNTQRVFIIDSLVTDKENFLSAIPLPRDYGRILSYSDFFGTSGQEGSYVYVNGFNNKCFYFERDTAGTVRILTRDKIGNRWSNPQPLEGIGSFSPQMAFPFMMSDGTTLYFAAKGKESLGGYDIFVTRYDAEEGRYLKPENIGLPFNSKADDYMYVEDDLNQLAWFVTSRNQPEGKVCVYTLVPSANRQNYDLGATDEERVKQLASISSIRDTWPSVAKRNQALKKLNDLRTAESTASPAQGNIYFPINDRLVYTSLEQFSTAESRELFNRVQALSDELRKEEHHLDLIRKEYRNTQGDTRQRLAEDILDYERIIERQKTEIHTLSKQIRNMENQNI